MVDQDNRRAPNVWRAFSIWPSEAIDAVLARESQAGTLAVAFLVAALVTVWWAADSFAAAPPLFLAAVLTAGTLYSALVVVPTLYAYGWFVQAIARLFGGRGSPKAARAALVWGQFPATMAWAVAALATLAGESLLAAFAATAIFLCFPWGLLRSTWMLAHTHVFSRFGAFLSVIGGGVAVSVLAAAIAFLLAAGFRTLVVQPFVIPSGAMVPTLVVGDNLFASKSVYGWSRYSLPWRSDLFAGRILGREPERGDIIVFKLPSDGQTDYIKRLIGLPGDKIQVAHGRLIINGQMVPREPIAAYLTVNHFNKPMEAPQYLETLPGGVQYRIIQIDGDDGTFDNTKVYEVPPGHYFMMGDNRDNSSDSRLSADQGGVGYVPFENLIGKAVFIFKSNDPGRFGTAIR